MNKTFLIIILSTFASTVVLVNMMGLLKDFRTGAITRAEGRIEQLEATIATQEKTIETLKTSPKDSKTKNQELEALETENQKLKDELLNNKNNTEPVEHTWQDNDKNRNLFSGKILRKVFDPASNKDRFIFLMKDGEVRVPEYIYVRYKKGEQFNCDPEICYPL